MRSLKLWHCLLTGAVVVIAVSLAVKHMFGNESRWQNTRTIDVQSSNTINHTERQLTLSSPKG
jgi:hypothetical protein